MDALLERLHALLAQMSRRVVDVFPALFRRLALKAMLSLLGLAIGESQACLNCLLRRGGAHLKADSDGVRSYGSTIEQPAGQ
jgi:hypothetical protein